MEFKPMPDVSLTTLEIYCAAPEPKKKKKNAIGLADHIFHYNYLQSKLMLTFMIVSITFRANDHKLADL
jgi:hypothetical protein